MWRVIVALLVAIFIGYLGLEFMAWLFKGTLGVIGTLISLAVTALVFWLVYRFFAEKIEDHQDDKAHERAIQDAYQRGVEEGRRQALEGTSRV